MKKNHARDGPDFTKIVAKYGSIAFAPSQSSPIRLGVTLIGVIGFGSGAAILLLFVLERLQVGGSWGTGAVAARGVALSQPLYFCYREHDAKFASVSPSNAASSQMLLVASTQPSRISGLGASLSHLGLGDSPSLAEVRPFMRDTSLWMI